MRISLVFRVLTLTGLVAFAFVSAAASAQPAAGSADARLRALYTEEWTWRRQELAAGATSPASGRG